MQIDQAYLKSILSYDKETGDFYWKDKNRCVRKPDAKAGSKNRGYIRIRINGIAYSAHRLAWLYITGKLPEQEIDHINRIKDDNRFLNLRDVSHSKNMTNRNAKVGLKSLVAGVYWREKKNWTRKKNVCTF
jgi:hypothetical protein